MTVAAWVALCTTARAEDADSTAAISKNQEKALLETDQCIICHTDDDNMPEGYLAEDVHMQHGLSCSGCHGGDPTSDDPDVAMSEEKGFVGVPDRDKIPEFCGRCHSYIEFMRRYQPRIPTDQVTQYYTSVHGQKLRKGDRKVAECASCHTAHGILSAHDARSTVYALNVPGTCNHCHGDADYMKPYGIPTNQYAKYAKSVHGVALLEKQDTGAPACNDCHGNHGAVPPATNSVGEICGQCHVNNMAYFRKTRMAEAFVEEGFHDCEECHGNHAVMPTSDKMVGITEGAVCLDCHDDGDKGYEAARGIRARLDTLTSTYDTASGLLEDVRTRGMDEVDIAFILQESHTDLIQARTLVHTFDPEKVAVKTSDGTKKAEEAITMSNAAIEDYYFRRRGFGLATGFITLLVIALFLKIRQMERG